MSIPEWLEAGRIRYGMVERSVSLSQQPVSLPLCSDKQELKRRARAALLAPIPASVLWSLPASRQYKDDACVLAAFVDRGVGLDRARTALSRIESQLRQA